MNIIDAIKSGKRYRRKGYPIWFADASGDRGLALLPSDILADDWEIEEPTVTITRSQFLATFIPVLGSEDAETIAADLGLREP